MLGQVKRQAAQEIAMAEATARREVNEREWLAFETTLVPGTPEVRERWQAGPCPIPTVLAVCQSDRSKENDGCDSGRAPCPWWL